ncbi:MAG TPA: DNA methyltransferase [Deltaproteobacteria bacterium]|nr:MAG: DNA methyltransferase [Deltaproteobacteria bacterium GWD2_42_10]OGP46115.1 MAG: DNA methyltransferase [Deltaproteobacteria bacterium GWF2_42_12]OGQ71972.1 MAG: DNA methyltransferase [Deltaproteobacteria bacterium RIFOXYA2_FULL_42_10]HAG49931.1 DNA methyltransferase [Deltaproteobacteria bacterium]HCY20179.1 DNA methyltransferase [Deltaproteobacteria bacterium]
MSKLLINQYYTNLDRALQFGKSRNEDAIKSYFWMLLNDYAHKNNYEVVREVYCMGTCGSKVKPDGILKNLWGLDVGYWESKDEKDVIDDEIGAKIKKGYPLSNTLFEDSQTAVLFQRGEEVMRVSVRDTDKLHAIITAFISYKNEAVYKFEDAIEKFKHDIPVIIETLRRRIEEAGAKNEKFIKERDKFLKLCKDEINPDITLADIREMMIQHILTGDIFNKIFDDPEFHRHNTIAAELEKLIGALFTYGERRNLLASIEHYYDAINAAAAAIADHHEKQKFLKVLYENFYKVYNPKAADRLGVVYTPNEIVKFMIESADYLLHKHFGKTLADKNVEILDPASGTGTFICDIIEHIPKQHLTYKYKNELHANEVAILPYYVANLNIEYTYKQKMGNYEEFPNICFVDTLDNTAPLDYSGKQESIFALTNENAERIRRQNRKKISVIIGNPPYNANQKNENENNKNREYPEIDKRIKETYIKNSTAQKTKMYDMYSRFYRWAMDRIDKNGVIAFITNRSFIDSRTFDGFRKWVEDHFSHAYIVDTKSDVRANPKIAGTTHNVFGIQTGVAIMFLVRKEKQEANCRIEYVSMDDFWRKEEKLEWLRTNQLQKIEFAQVTPDKGHNWINISENGWEDLMILVEEKSKKSLVGFISIGASTNRDEWVFDLDANALMKKVRYFIDSYNSKLSLKTVDFNDEKIKDIKWSDSLKAKFKNKNKLALDSGLSIPFIYRPFFKLHYCSDKNLSDRLTSNHFEMFGHDLKENNLVIGFSGIGSSKPFSVVATSLLFGVDFLEKTQSLPLYRYDKHGNRIDNITDWGLEQFRSHYKDKKIKKEDIFHYVYAVLHNPAYRKKYELNLKREFPRIPFYKDFRKWAKWGKKLMELHIGYEVVEPYSLKVITSDTKGEHKKMVKDMFEVHEPTAMFSYKPKIKVKLKADKERGVIEVDELTTMTGIPKEAWAYKLGNRSAIEWVLDQYKEKKPSDPTIAEKFNTYRFSDYKDKVIDLLKQVCTVSVETMKIIREMEREGD